MSVFVRFFAFRYEPNSKTWIKTQRIMTVENSCLVVMPVTQDQLFNKRIVAELSDWEMMEVNGGSTPVCAAAAASSSYCAGAAGAAAIFVAAAIYGYYDN